MAIVPPPAPVLTADQEDEVNDLIDKKIREHFEKLEKWVKIVAFGWTLLMLVGGFAIKASIETGALTAYLDRLTDAATAVAKADAEAQNALDKAKKSASEAATAADKLKGSVGEVAIAIRTSPDFQSTLEELVDDRLGRFSIGSEEEGYPLVLNGNLIVDGTVTVRTIDPTTKKPFKAIELSYDANAGVLNLNDRKGHAKVQLHHESDNRGGRLSLYAGAADEDPGGRASVATGLTGFP